ncbi:WXG100 family type VII secretion target [Lentzea sp. BCCO 10_0061]|uniref:WXG100 family type VII secretion target n=1 Tax=Lentzea sokolovensis TaxID=3095429 RepID=A0ABU4V234_9PSEU|nr:WXG100 family type VII secretion target [Lentzea sp. BCCO 10_0061]MDX8145855.1 WXG100 family type VII secretion target [Lentzea sp. BCCO 10_0061]
MTGFQVQGGALTAHGQGSREAAGHFGQLATLLDQARVSDDCFGPLGELMAFKYFEGLRECQEMANKAKGFLEGVAERTDQTAQTYRDVEDAIHQGLQKFSSGGPGSLADLNSAGDGNRKSDFEQNAGYGSSWMSTSGDISRAGSPPDVAIAAVNARMEQLRFVMSPGQSFIDNGLGFLIGIVISPIVELVLEPAIGDPEQMRSTGTGWGKVADWVKQTGEHEKSRAAATSEPWTGQAGDKFRKQMDEFGAGAEAFSNEIRGLQQMLELAADLFDAFVEICIDILQELVMGLIIEWLAALAASWITAGASMAAAGVATTAQVGGTMARLGLKVKQLLGKLKPLIDKLEDLLQALRKGPLRKLVEKAEGLREGNMAEKWVMRKIDANPLAKIVTKADPATMASKTGNRFAGRFGVDGAGADSLTTNLTEAGLRTAGLSGTTHVPTAITNGIMENAPGLAVEQGIKYGYDKGQDPSSDEDRADAMNRGFEYE